MTVSIDTDAAAQLSAAWSQVADDVATAQFEVERLVDEMMLEPGDGAAWRSLASAAGTLWTAATLLSVAVDAAISGDRVDVATLIAGAQLDAPRPYSPRLGELGQIFVGEMRHPLVLEADSDLDLGVEVITACLKMAASPTQIRPDEFGLARFGPNQVVVVLPGVVDLSKLDAGWSDTNATPRELDKGAVPAFLATALGIDLGLNAYGRQVRQALLALGVAPGTEVVIVGHSYGAETAIELASDDEFASRYHVTHVVAAGYDSEPQLDDVPGDTRVHVLQNNSDVPMQAERVARSLIQTLQEELAPVEAWNLVRHPTSIVTDPIGALKDDPFVLAGPVYAPIGGVRKLVGWFDDDDDDEHDNVSIQRSWSGTEGAGHHPSNYADLVGRLDPGAVVMLTEIGALLATSQRRQRRNPPPRQATATVQAVDISLRTHES